MNRGLRQFCGLPAADRWLFVRALLALVAIDLRLRLYGFRRTVEGNHKHRRPGKPTSIHQWTRISRYAHWLGVASRHHVVRARCLHRSLALHGWLLQQGLPGELRIGVRKEGTELTAHAWIELDGRPIFDRPEEVAGFTPLVQQDGRLANWLRGAGNGVSASTEIPVDGRGLRWQ